MKTLSIMLAVALATTACATHKIHYKNPTVATSGQTKSAKQSFFLWGLVGGKEIDLQQMCPNGVAGIDSKSSGVDSILTYLTGGLYSPMSVDVHCAGGAVATGGAQ
jgi:Bor protein